MSRLHFNSPSGQADLSGSEHALFRQLAARPGHNAWDFESSVKRLDRIASVIALIPEGNDAGFRDLLSKAQEEAARNKAAWENHPGGGIPYTDHEMQQRLAQSFTTHLAVTNVPLDVASHRLMTGDLEANTALVAGSDVIRLAAKFAFWGWQHAFIEGEDRAWLADLCEQGLRTGIFRWGMWYVDRVCDGLPEDQPDRKWAKQGWEGVLEFLRARDDEPVVLSYSVDDDFPNPGIAGWEPPPMPAGWMPDWADDEQGRAEWEQSYPSEDDQLEYYRECAGDRWYDLPEGQRWQMAWDGLKRTRPWARISPDTLAEVTFGPSLSLYDLFAPDRNERVQAAFSDV